jgi:hypothetical protein
MIRIILEGKESIDIDWLNNNQTQEIKEQFRNQEFQSKITHIQILDNNKKFKTQLEKPNDTEVVWLIGKIGYSQMNLNTSNKNIQSYQIGEIISFYDPKKNYKKIIKHYIDGKIVHSKTKYNKKGI